MKSRKFNLFVGIDVSKQTLDVAISHNGNGVQHSQVTNDASGIHALVTWLLRVEPDPSQILVCLEHTGNIIEKLCHVLLSRELFTWVVNPYVIKRNNPVLERGKTDKSCSVKIMHFAESHCKHAQCYEPRTGHIQQVKALFLLRKQLVGLRRQILNQNAANNDKLVPDPICSGTYKRIKEQLTAEIKVIERQIIVLMREDSSLTKIYQILLSVPGIGPVTAQHLLFVTDGFKRFNNYKQMACYIGTAPFPHQSGSSVYKRPRTSKKAYGALKADLHQGVLSVTRKGRFFGDYYNFMKNEKGKHHNWIINAIINMILKVVFKLVEKKVEFEDNFFLQNKQSWQKLLQLS